MIAKTKLNMVEVLTSKALICSNISHDKLVLVKYLLKEFDDMKKEIKNSSNIKVFDIIKKILYLLYQHNKITKKIGNNLIKSL